MRHTDWCAGGHRCAAGEHRSDPITIRHSYGPMVLTRVLSRTGAEWLEVRLSIQFTPRLGLASALIRRLAGGLDCAARAALTAGSAVEEPMWSAPRERERVWGR